MLIKSPFRHHYLPFDYKLLAWFNFLSDKAEPLHEFKSYNNHSYKESYFQHDVRSLGRQCQLQNFYTSYKT